MRISREADLACVIFCIFICVVCLIVRVYSLKNFAGFNKFACIALCSIFFAVLLSCMILFIPLLRYSVIPPRYCTILFRFSIMFYVFHRISFLVFNTWRIDLVNGHGAISKKTIYAIWLSIFAYGLFFIAGPFFMTEPKIRYGFCPFTMKNIAIIIASAFDIAICLVTSWLFVRPLTGMKKAQEKAVHRTIMKEFFCVIIYLLVKIVAVSCIGLFNGLTHIWGGFDAALTTCCVVELSSPVRISNATERESSIKSYFSYVCLCRSHKLENIRAIISDLSLQLSNVFSQPPSSTRRLADEIDQILAAMSLSETSLDQSSLVDVEAGLGQKIRRSTLAPCGFGDNQEIDGSSMSAIICSTHVLKLSSINLIEYVDAGDWKTDFVSERYTIREEIEIGKKYPSYEIKLSN